MTGDLNKEQINSVLSSQVIGRLACSDGNQPYVVPVTFAYDGEYIYAQTNEGKKLDIMRKNNLVCFEVDMMTDMRNWQSVILDGTFEELSKEEAERGRERLFGNIFSLMTSSSIHLHEHGPTGEIDDSTRIKYVIFRIKIKTLTGKFEKQ